MKRALLVIDVQNEYFTGKMPVIYPAGSLGNILLAMNCAADRGIPVILIQHSSPKDSNVFAKGSDGWQIHKDVLACKHDYVIEKKLPGSFTGTGLEDLLKQEGVDTVVISGYMTQMCCDTTSRQAMHLGYAVEFLSDATGTLAFTNNAGSVTAEELHKAILVTQASLFSKVLSTMDWIEAISK